MSSVVITVFTALYCWLVKDKTFMSKWPMHRDLGFRHIHLHIGKLIAQSW